MPQLPAMILFDYGNTLLAEEKFDGAAGTAAVLAKCVDNPRHVGVEEIQKLARELDGDIGRETPAYFLELTNHVFQRYLYEYFDITPLISQQHMEEVFWDNAAPAEPTPHIKDFLARLKARSIRTGVVSNLSFSGITLERRIQRLLPDNAFEFILTSSDYGFRKPHRRMFELALRKAGLAPGKVWYCGDNVLWDVEGAYNSGLTPVWYKGALAEGLRPSPPSCPYIEIADWMELDRILEDMANP